VKRLVTTDFPLTGTSDEVLQRSGAVFFTPEKS
jgi:hypothetical protein